jgi:hypothetical protein
MTAAGGVTGSGGAGVGAGSAAHTGSTSGSAGSAKPAKKEYEIEHIGGTYQVQIGDVSYNVSIGGKPSPQHDAIKKQLENLVDALIAKNKELDIKSGNHDYTILSTGHVHKDNEKKAATTISSALLRTITSVYQQAMKANPSGAAAHKGAIVNLERVEDPIKAQSIDAWVKSSTASTATAAAASTAAFPTKRRKPNRRKPAAAVAKPPPAAAAATTAASTVRSKASPSPTTLTAAEAAARDAELKRNAEIRHKSDADDLPSTGKKPAAKTPTPPPLSRASSTGSVGYDSDSTDFDTPRARGN